jgi:hypothetical protein
MSSAAQSRRGIDEQSGVQLDGVLYELGVLGVQWVGLAGGFAGFYGAGEEIEGEDFHILLLANLARLD